MALLQAVDEKNLSVVMSLLQDPKYDVNEENDHGDTALIISASRATTINNVYGQILQRILQHPRCNVNHQNKGGFTAFRKALQLFAHTMIIAKKLYFLTPRVSNNTDVLHLFLNHPDCETFLNLPDRTGRTVLIWATEEKYIDILKLLLNTGKCHVNWKNPEGRGPLHLAAKSSHKIVQLFTRNGAFNINLEDDIGQSPLHYAALGLDPQAVKCFLQFSTCDVNKQDIKGMTALHAACSKYNSNAFSLLLADRRCDITLLDKEGHSALHMAAAVANRPALQGLLSHPRSHSILSIIDHEGESALVTLINTLGNTYHFATLSHHKEAFSILLTSEKLVNATKHTLALATNRCSFQLCKYLCQSSADVNSAYEHNESALHCAVTKESIYKCKLYQAHGANTETKWRNMTPLQYAISLSLGADLIIHLSKGVQMSIIENFIQMFGVVGETALTCSVRLRIRPWIEHFSSKYNLLQNDQTKINAMHLAKKDRSVENLMRTLSSSKHTCPKCLALKQYYAFLKCCGTKLKVSRQPQKIEASSLFKLVLQQWPLCLANQPKETMDIQGAVLEVVKALASIISEMKETSHFQFKPLLAGSMSEGTKTYIPNEFDIICEFTQLDAVDIKAFNNIQVPLSSPWSSMTNKIELKNNKEKTYQPHLIKKDAKVSQAYAQLLPVRVAAEFYDAIDIALEVAIQRQLSFGNIHLFRKSLCLKEKISMLQLLWRGSVYKDLTIYVDLCPAFPFPQFIPAQTYPFGLQPNDYHLITKVSRYIPGNATSEFQVSQSRVERSIIYSLPSNFRDGLILAKALRNASINAVFSHTDFLLQEDIDIEDFVTSYMLKTSLFYILKENTIDLNLSALQLSDMIYGKLESFLLSGNVPSFHDQGYIFTCHADARDELEACCLKKKVMLHLCATIRSWLFNITLGKHLVYAKKRFIWHRMLEQI